MYNTDVIILKCIAKESQQEQHELCELVFLKKGHALQHILIATKAAYMRFSFVNSLRTLQHGCDGKFLDFKEIFSLEH